MTLKTAKKKGKQALLAGLMLVIGFEALQLCIPPFRADLKRYPCVTSICDRRGGELRTTLGAGDTMCRPITLADSGKWTALAVISLEDKRFHRHHGVDFLAVSRALVQNILAGRIVSGASTISTLVVKLTDPRPRTIWTKIVEASHARQLEDTIRKDEILTQYLNRAPFGRNIVGIEAASRRYFGKPARELSLSESALLAGIPQKPETIRPDMHPEAAIAQRNKVLARMKACGNITSRQLAMALAEEVVLTHTRQPFKAPHFCDLVRNRCSAPGGSIRTTLDPDLQEIAQTAIRSRMADIAGSKVSGGAVVIIDVKASAVRAMVGSPDFGNAIAAGQVNAAISQRSPGSALKPFIYAMALDQGLCSPQTILNDAPKSFAGYKPENFDHSYIGPVSLRNALIASLNIPALEITMDLGLDRVVAGLRELGISTLDRSPASYGLSIAIGTCETTLLDLAGAYACLAREGVYAQPRLTEAEPVQPGTRVLSREAAFMIADILSGDERQFDITGHVADSTMSRIAWKTGTSSGRRDMLTIAWNPQYVVAVWLGNPDGSATKDIDSNDAAMTAMNIFRRVYPDGHGPWYSRPESLATRMVCTTSGNPSCLRCVSTIPSDYILGVTVSESCGIHDSRHADTFNAIASCSTAPDTDTDKDRVRLSQTGQAPTSPIRIASPTDNAVFRLMDDMPLLKQELALNTSGGDNARPVYWFVDGELYYSGRQGKQILWPLNRGRHIIACASQSGESDHVEIMVE